MLRTEYILIGGVLVVWKYCNVFKNDWIPVLLIIVLAVCSCYNQSEGLPATTAIQNTMQKRKIKVKGENIEDLKRTIHTLEHKLKSYQNSYMKLMKKYKSMKKVK